MTDNAAFVRDLYEAWNDRNFDKFAESMAPGGKIVVMGTGDTFEGPEGGVRYGEGWANAFPDGKITIDTLVVDGDHVVVEFTGTGTHTGTLVTSMGDIPATGKSVTLKLCDSLDLRDGKVEMQRSYIDTGSMMAQLGLTAGQSATANQ